MEGATSLGKVGMQGGNTEKSPVIIHHLSVAAHEFTSILSSLDFLIPPRSGHGAGQNRGAHSIACGTKTPCGGGGRVCWVYAYLSPLAPCLAASGRRKAPFSIINHIWRGFAILTARCMRQPHGGEAVCVPYGCGEVCLLDLDGWYNPPPRSPSAWRRDHKKTHFPKPRCLC